jgi:hypothetical protein
MGLLQNIVDMVSRAHSIGNIPDAYFKNPVGLDTVLLLHPSLGNCFTHNMFFYDAWYPWL